MKLITTLIFIILLILTITAAVLLVMEFLKIHRFIKRNTIVTLERLIKPLEEPLPNIKTRNQIIKEAIIELDKKAMLDHKQTLGGKYE